MFNRQIVSWTEAGTRFRMLGFLRDGFVKTARLYTKIRKVNLWHNKHWE